MQLQLHCNTNSSLQSLNVARTHRRGGGIGSDDRQKVQESGKRRIWRPSKGCRGRRMDVAAEPLIWRPRFRYLWEILLATGCSGEEWMLRPWNQCCGRSMDFPNTLCFCLKGYLALDWVL
ncbi:hypothetical protein RHMOL_Rhmol04G0196400 [Rhododendron molle]|uniref:Uncharacterized protein n=1 Tax=Rhododendron molle TaxID=49168 RepID=A0ACC0P2P2_RHOML|nr:hypothetical protein RHMOL_Rhmol04G0196400 [Rhododendron molle]